MIICATDDDREGDLIFDYIYRFLGCNVPFKRALFSQQSKEEWKRAFRKDYLIDGEDRLNVIEAGRGRSAGDFVVGANLTTAMSLHFPGNGVLSVGRVQTAVLSMIVARELEIREFKPKDYWVLKGTFKAQKGVYEGTHISKRFEKREKPKRYFIRLLLIQVRPWLPRLKPISFSGTNRTYTVYKDYRWMQIKYMVILCSTHLILHSPCMKRDLQPIQEQTVPT